jgi:hypothetical protein
MDQFLFLEIVALILTGLLIYHSTRLRGSVFTWMFFLGGTFLGVFRENIVAQFTPLYSYNALTFHLWIGAAPLILAVFWSYSIYISLSLSETIIRGSLINGKRRIGVIVLSMMFMAAYACFNEAYSSIFPMVIWKFKPAITIWGGTPLMVLWGYAGMAMIFLVTLFLIHNMHSSRLWRILVMCCSTILMIPLHLLWLLFFQKIIALL